MWYRFKQRISKESQMANRHFRKGSTSSAIKEMQIKTTLKFHLIPVRIAKIKNISDSSCCQRNGARGTLFH